MPAESALRGSIGFLNDLGIYDVVLPFILIFTVVYAILEKSKIFGTEKIGDQEVSRKNLNSMFAFVTAFLVVASTQIVSAVNQILAQVMLLLILGISILLLTGVFHTGDKEFAIERRYKNFLNFIMIAGSLIIFLNAIKTKEGTTWLEFAYEFVVNNIDTAAGSALILTLIIIVIVLWVTNDPSVTEAKRDRRITRIKEGEED